MSDHHPIEGEERLIAHFGRWPSFHDAEVVRLAIERRPNLGRGDGPTLDLTIHAFETTRELEPDGCFRLRRHAVVRFRFDGVVDLELRGFNEQNVLFDLSIADRPEDAEGCRVEVSLHASYGLWGRFRCRRVEVAEVVPCTAEGEGL